MIRAALRRAAAAPLSMLVLALCIGAAARAGAQTPTPQPPKGQMPDLGRPTKDDDKLPPFDFDTYFLGTWTFEWDVPESAIGPAGRLEGQTVYTALGDGMYQAITTATGPAGPLTIKELIRYKKGDKTLSREVTDSRGYTYTQRGTIGGDLGGSYYIYFESEPVRINGKSVRLKHNLRLTAPLSYRVAASVSEDDGPFVNYGNPWWRKQLK
jgi:hypothetical protein